MSLSVPAHEGGRSQRGCSTLRESRQGIRNRQGTGCSQTHPKPSHRQLGKGLLRPPPLLSCSSARERLGRAQRATDLQSSSKCAEKESPSRRPSLTSWSSKARLQLSGGSPPTALLAAEPLSPAGMGKGEAKHGPRPWKGSGEEEFTFCSYIPAAKTHRRSRGTLQKPPLPPPCWVAG